MTIMILYHEGQRVVFEGSMAEVLERLRAWCPSGRGGLQPGAEAVIGRCLWPVRPFASRPRQTAPLPGSAWGRMSKLFSALRQGQRTV